MGGAPATTEMGGNMMTAAKCYASGYKDGKISRNKGIQVKPLVNGESKEMNSSLKPPEGK